MSTTRTAAKKRRTRSPGWIPDQHGAWAMITIPALSGVVLAGPDRVHVPLVLFWWIGYFAFQAAALWLKSRRKARYLPPARAYALAAVPFGIATIVMEPALALWAVPFAPLIAIAVWSAMTRRERSLLNDTATVLAACLMLAVTFDAAAPTTDPRWPWVWTVTAVQFAYFWGTIPHVKALIRERNNPAYHRFSAAYHAVVALGVTVAVAAGAFPTTPLAGWLLAAVWVGLAVRAAWMPAHQRRTAPMKPMTIGLTEVMFSLLIAWALLG